MRYRDRLDAGQKLGAALERAGYSAAVNPIILGVARGGVPVAAEVAPMVGGQLDVAVARKIGAPGNPEFAIGAIAGDGGVVLNDAVISAHRISPDYVEEAIAAARAEVVRRSDVYRRGRGPLDLAERTVIVVDDGVATGSTVIATLRAVRATGAARTVCAVPVGPPATIAALQGEADDVVCPLQPPSFVAVGSWYEVFDQLTDREVVARLER